jgi:hypothetical protein
MKATSVNINKSIQAISVYMVHQISKEENCSNDEALIMLLKSMTYELLQNKENKLYAETPEYVWSLYQDEKNNDLESWKKI